MMRGEEEIIATILRQKDGKKESKKESEQFF